MQEVDEDREELRQWEFLFCLVFTIDKATGKQLV